jgi:hypothetical protein
MDDQSMEYEGANPSEAASPVNEVGPENVHAEEPIDLPPPSRSEETPLRLRRRRRRREWKFAQAFWTVTGLLSLTVNVILIVLLLALGQQLFTLKQVVEKQLLGGLYQNFILMDQAHIRTTIPVQTEVPAKFDLPLKTDTVVILTEDTVLENASVAKLTTGGLTIENAPATIVLRSGTRLPVALDLSVPVDQMIPVSLNVDVDIPLNKTDLHEPFVGLQETVRPYYRMLGEMPGSWEAMICGPQPAGLCRWVFSGPRN